MRLRAPAMVRPVAVWLTTMFVVAACSNSNPLGAQVRSPDSIVVGSGDFPESQIIAEIYAQALQANGFDVGKRMGIGSRETYISAIKDHSIDLVPEYIGNLLLYFEPASSVTTLDAVEQELHRRLPADLSILTPAPATDTDTVSVTSQAANPWNLRTIGDLAPHSADVRFGAPSAFATRPAGLPGLRQKYGLDIKPGNFVAIDDDDDGGAVTVRALLEGRVNATNIFTTSPAIPQHHLVALDDPEANLMAGNVVPLVNSQKHPDRLKLVLDAVSAKLTTPGVAGLNAAVSGSSGVDPDQDARNWVWDNGLNHPIGP
ncbi:L-proline glycine betaine binding ABC transporter protein ProX [Mycobacterium lepraemurium]|nr:L-proline glycine betaine binding ABC transporter protein ProX [Mycobacterium lepraemurium]